MRFIKIMVVLIVSALVFTSCFDFSKIKARLNAIQIADVDFTKIKNGDYEGAADYTIVNAKVRVTVLDGKITGIKILEHGHGPNHGGDAITNQVIQKQSLKVDGISGSTSSGKVILKAIETALNKGM